MLSVKRWCAALLVTALLITGAAAAWIYYGPSPKKAPVRARQVITSQIYHPQNLSTEQGYKTASIKAKELNTLWTELKFIFKEAK